MTIVATRNIPIKSKPVRVPGLLETIVKNVRSLLKSPAKTAPPVQGFKEILPYGFVSRNYIEYMSKSISLDRVTELVDGTRVCQFENGGVLLDTRTGHMVELDKQGRVVLVRVHSSEVVAGNLDCCPSERSSMLGISADAKSTTMELPGGISVVSLQQEVRIRLPNGTTYSQPVKA